MEKFDSIIGLLGASLLKGMKRQGARGVSNYIPWQLSGLVLGGAVKDFPEAVWQKF
jgi:hypothetical protein